jgi:hypothetical protein
MKRITLISLMFVARIASAGEPLRIEERAEPAPTQRNVVYVNPVGLIGGVYSLGYERVLSPYLSFAIEGMYLHDQSNGVTGTGVGAGVVPHLYLLGRAPSGLYLAPALRIAAVSAEGLDASGTGTGYSLGATTGWSWIWGPVNLKLGIGAAYFDMVAVARTSDGTDQASVGAHGIGLTGDLSFGFAF